MKFKSIRVYFGILSDEIVLWGSTMNITKPTLTLSKKLSRTLDFIARITYLQVENADKFNLFNKTVAEKTHRQCEALSDSLGVERNGAVVALLEPSVTYFDGDIISAKYDFTVTGGGELLFHRRFCITYLLKYDLFLLPSFLRGVGRWVKADRFYLTRIDGEPAIVRLKSTRVSAGIKLARRSQIDDFCNGEARKVKIKLPHCLDSVAIRKKKQN